MSRVPIVQPGVLDAIHAHVNSAWARKVGGILIGRPSGDAVKVEGALPARQTLECAQEIAFPPSVWEEAYAALDRYPGARIMGWYHSHPGSGVALTEYDRRLHTAMFSEPSNVAPVVDPIAQTLAWFGWAIVPLSSDDPAVTRAFSGTAAGHRGRDRRRQAAVAGLVARGIAAGGAAGYGVSAWRGEQRSAGQESLGARS